MSLHFTFTCPLPNGIHARPASSIEETARAFGSTIALVNVRTGAQADAKSVLSMVGADVKIGDSCRVTISGCDESAAHDALKSFIENVLPLSDEALPESPQVPGTTGLPVSLRNANITALRGCAVSPGIGRGCAVFAHGFSLSVAEDQIPVRDAECEWRLVTDALVALQTSLESHLRETLPPTESAVVKAHLSIARDPSLGSHLHEAVTAKRLSAARAVRSAYDYFAHILGNAESRYIRERLIDVQDICAQLLQRIYGPAATTTKISLTGPSIIVADNLAPSQLLAINRELLRGLVLKDAGTTSHVVILARSFGIPALTGVADPAMRITNGSEIIIDADIGAVITQITPPVEGYYRQEAEKLARLHARFAEKASLPGVTADGVALEVAANIAVSEESDGAFANGAEGVGLFRTEMLFMERSAAPSEEEQYQAYRRVVQSAAGRPVIIRTIDVGGDKPLPYLTLPREDNPFLGFRGVRAYGTLSAIIKTQLRAIIRASVHGTVKVMVPMVSCVEEVRLVKGFVHEIQADLAREGVPHDPAMQVGIMIEVPAAAFSVKQLSAESDFFSIGTNDLAQYFLAVDRGNAAVSHLYNCREASFIGLLSTIVRDAHACGKWVGMCGEMAGDPRNLPLLVGMGIDEISVASRRVPEIKTALSSLESGACRALVESARTCATPGDVTGLLSDFCTVSGDRPLVDDELIIVCSLSTSKEEVIKELADALFLSGRTDRPAAVEEAVWQREHVYSTGLGYGFAIPHCKTDSVLANSIAVLKPAAPVCWGSQDDKPVEVVILLAIKESDAANGHMKIFAKLARKIMHEEFRETLLRAGDPSQIRAILEENLDLHDWAHGEVQTQRAQD